MQMIDSSLVAKYTTWNPEKGPQLDFLTPYTETLNEDRIDFLFTASMFRFGDPEVHIGIYNTHENKEPVTFDIQMREFTGESCLPDDLSKLNEVF